MPGDMDARVRERLTSDLLRSCVTSLARAQQIVRVAWAAMRAADVAERIAMARALLEGTGFVVVPVEPTDDMLGEAASTLAAPRQRLSHRNSDDVQTALIGWRAMLDAAERSASEKETDK